MTSYDSLYQSVQAHLGKQVSFLCRAAPNEMLLRVEQPDALRTLAAYLSAEQFYLVSLIGTDERKRLDRCFKLSYLFSHPQADLFLFVEYPLLNEADAPVNEVTTYPSLFPFFKAVDPFERALVDLMGLTPFAEASRPQIAPGDWLHPECYPPELYPLRRDRSPQAIREQIEAYGPGQPQLILLQPHDGEWIMPVGPIHAGVIEPGLFLFRLGGEIVEELRIRLGYTHKGIEQLFQSQYTLEHGWRLAEHVSGDSACAHALAYCQAVEALAKLELPPAAQLLRGLWLELERMANHIGDCAALAQDVAYGVVAMDLAMLRERLLAQNAALFGHRLLRKLNRPGGVVLPQALGQSQIEQLREEVRAVAERFAGLAQHLTRASAFRDRLRGVGILTRQQALELGATGLVARAAGLPRDLRLHHPTGIYRDPQLRELLASATPDAQADAVAVREARAGDAFARFLVRVREVESAQQIIEAILAHESEFLHQSSWLQALPYRQIANFEAGLGYVEGWRGDIVYWVMKDKFERIFRCSVRDPSLLNWPTLKAAAEPHELDDDYLQRYGARRRCADILIADFPILNKSFNLSYSGNDL